VNVDRTNQEIQEQIDLALTHRRYTAQTYEEGVEEALRWILGEEDTPPMDHVAN
jgi:hypothetical protein